MGPVTRIRLHYEIGWKDLQILGESYLATNIPSRACKTRALKPTTDSSIMLYPVFLMLWSLRSTSKSNMCVHVSPSILTRPPRKAKRHETNHQSLSTRLASALARPPPNGISLGEADFVEEKALESAAFPYSPETRKPWCTLKSLQIRNSLI